MTRVAELGSVAKLLPHSLLSHSWIWNREVSEVTGEELCTFLRIAQLNGKQVEARRNIDTLLHETFRGMVEGRVEFAPYANFQESVPPFTVHDLAETLEPMSKTRRAATIYALETEIGIRQTITLDWHKALKRQAKVSGLAEEIVRMQPRHLRLNYVFWETLDNSVAAPLFGLEEELTTVTGWDYANLQAQYRRMAWVDQEAEVNCFIETMEVRGYRKG